MKPRNFPARKLHRQHEAARRNGTLTGTADERFAALNNARQMRTKKYRAKP